MKGLAMSLQLARRQRSDQRRWWLTRLGLQLWQMPGLEHWWLLSWKQRSQWLAMISRRNLLKAHSVYIRGFEDAVMTAVNHSTWRKFCSRWVSLRRSTTLHLD